MPAAELAFERFAYALEATKGTAVTPPTHNLYLDGAITPETTFYEPTPTNGIRSLRNRQLLTRTHATLEASGAYDHKAVGHLLRFLVAPESLVATVAGSFYTRTFTPSMTADNLVSMTAYWGDPNTMVHRSTYVMLNEMTIESDASGTDGTTISITGFGKFPTTVAAPAFPATAVTGNLTPAYTRLYMGTGSYTTTEIAGRLISASTTIRNGLVPKWMAAGGAPPTSGSALSFNRHGVGRTECEQRITLELTDSTQYDFFAAGTPVKMQVARFGAFVINDTGTDYFDNLRVFSYGPLRDLEWGDLEGTNRTVSFTQYSAYDSAEGTDFYVTHGSSYATV